MKKRKILLFAAVSLMIFTSCVSKKKFVEMQNGRLNAEEQVRHLTDENNARAARIEALISDFEAMKNELMENNSEKDQYIDNLSKEIAGLNVQLSEQKQSLQEKSFTYGFEKDRLSETVQERDKKILTLERQITELEKELSSQATTLSDRNIRINTLTDQMSFLENEKEAAARQQEAQMQQVENLKKEINTLKGQISEKDQTITRLQNNVNLLKREIGGGN